MYVSTEMLILPLKHKVLGFLRSVFKYVTSLFPVKSTKVERQYAEVFGSERLAFGLQIDTLPLPSLKLHVGFTQLSWAS